MRGAFQARVPIGLLSPEGVEVRGEPLEEGGHVTEAIVPTTEASTLYNTIQMTSSQTCYLAHLLVG